jgi:hypothetical protein
MIKTTKLIGLFSLTTCLFSAGIVAPASSQSQEYPTQVATDWFVTWELESCARKTTVISCTFSLSPSYDNGYTVYSDNSTKLVDSAGNEYYASKIQSGTKVVGANSQVNLNMVMGSHYKTTVDFNDVPNSVSYVTLLQISTSKTGSTGLAKFRNVPFINPDGSIPTVPRSINRSVNPQQQTPATNSPSIIPRVCLPLVGCTK